MYKIIFEQLFTNIFLLKYLGILYNNDKKKVLFTRQDKGRRYSIRIETILFLAYSPVSDK